MFLLFSLKIRAAAGKRLLLFRFHSTMIISFFFAPNKLFRGGTGMQSIALGTAAYPGRSVSRRPSRRGSASAGYRAFFRRACGLRKEDTALKLQA